MRDFKLEQESQDRFMEGLKKKSLLTSSKEIVTMVDNILHYRGYKGTIIHDDIHDYYHGHVLSIRSRLHYVGDDINALKRQFASTINDYIYDVTTTFGEL